MEKLSHIPVLLEATAGPLAESPGKLFVDGTVGGGGHLGYLLAKRPDARVIGLDRDAEAIQRVGERFREEIASGRLILVQESFANLDSVLRKMGIATVDGIMLDLGFSSYQVDDERRGFSFLRDGPLDMRLDQSRGQTAADIVNTWDRDELLRIFRDLGEERFARKVADAIVETRRNSPFATTGALAAVVKVAIPASSRFSQKIHPATRVFQALRIAVNGEIDAIERILSLLPGILNPGGAVSILTFHSLEDRPVKQRFKLLSDDCICPPHIMTCARCHKPPGKLLSRKPIIAAETETRENPRARSAKLRVLVRTEHPVPKA